MSFKYKVAFYFIVFLLAFDCGWAVVATAIRKTHRIGLLSISDVSVTEGGNLVFTVSSSVRPTGNASFNWTTSDGTAIGATHYTAASGVGTITAGTLSTTVTVSTIIVPPACDPDRTLTVTLSNPVDAIIVDDTGVGTIRGQIPTLSFNSPSATEGSNLDFVVTMSDICAQDVSFNYSTVNGTAQAGIDYSASSGLVTITSGLTTANVTVPTSDDLIREMTENVYLTVYNITQASSTVQSYGIGTINDDEAGVTIAKVAAGSEFTCAMSTAGVVKCWGRELYGRLGQGGAHLGDDASEVGDNLPYIDLGTGVTAVKISRGKYHVCVITSTDQVKCWGNGSYLGLGSNVDRGDNLGEMGDNLPYVNVGTGHTVRDIAVAPNAACVILNDYRVKCWGTQAYLDQLGAFVPLREFKNPYLAYRKFV